MIKKKDGQACKIILDKAFTNLACANFTPTYIATPIHARSELGLGSAIIVRRIWYIYTVPDLHNAYSRKPNPECIGLGGLLSLI